MMCAFSQRVQKDSDRPPGGRATQGNRIRVEFRVKLEKCEGAAIVDAVS